MTARVVYNSVQSVYIPRTCETFDSSVGSGRTQPVKLLPSIDFLHSVKKCQGQETIQSDDFYHDKELLCELEMNKKQLRTYCPVLLRKNTTKKKNTKKY